MEEKLYTRVEIESLEKEVGEKFLCVYEVTVPGATLYEYWYLSDDGTGMKDIWELLKVVSVSNKD